MAKASVFLDGFVLVALVPGQVAKPAESGERQGRQNSRLIWLLQSSAVFAVLGCPPKIQSGSGTFGVSFIHRNHGGGFKQMASAQSGAR